LRTALGRDLDDFFGFEVTRIVPLQEEAKGSRVHVKAMLGAKTFAVFHIDVVVATAMSGEPDVVAPLTSLHIDGLVRPSYRAFPLPDHVADKFAAILGTHVRGETVTGSSRIKDLVDIGLIATTQQISGPALRAAVLAGTAHRNLSLPDAFAVPDEAVWRRGYPQSAADAPGPTPTFDEAVSLACALLNPVLKGPVSGNWDPAAASWTPPAEYQPARPTGLDGPRIESAVQRAIRGLPGRRPCHRPARRSRPKAVMANLRSLLADRTGIAHGTPKKERRSRRLCRSMARECQIRPLGFTV
jgi:Nucleotidyl transferase AbiEii toxin, Type IV TA system